MAVDRRRPSGTLRISDSGSAKVGERGYSLADARAVYERDPLWKWQPEGAYVSEAGQLRIRPARWRLIGRGQAGDVLCVVIDLPDHNGDSQVVTIFEASPRHQHEYATWRRRAL